MKMFVLNSKNHEQTFLAIIQLGRVAELGSGVLNVNKYLEYYSPGKKPVFREGSTFKSNIPLDEVLLDGYRKTVIL